MADVAAVYIVVAKKCELGMTPLRPVWKTQQSLAPGLAGRWRGHDDMDLVEITPTAPVAATPAPAAERSCARTHEREIHGAERDTTNNRMELVAIQALGPETPVRGDAGHRLAVPAPGITMDVKWKKNGWRTADRKPVKNVDLWQRLEQAGHQHHIHWKWIRGHTDTGQRTRRSTQSRH